MDPVHPGLAAISGIDGFLQAFARFHAAVDAAADPADGTGSKLGANRRESYSFTRRGFLNTLRFIEVELAGSTGKKAAIRATWAAIDRYYLRKLASANDRTAVIELARAAGITQSRWKRKP